MTDFWNRHRDTDVIEVTVRRVEGSALRVRETFCADLKTVRAALSRPAGDEGVREDWTMTAVPTDNAISTLAPNKVQDDLIERLENFHNVQQAIHPSTYDGWLKEAAAELRSLRATRSRSNSNHKGK